MSTSQPTPPNGQNGVLYDSKWKRTFRRRILAWYAKHARELPWRKTREPYPIWVSEIMLQQTQVVTVQSYFERFIHKYPDIKSLAAAPEQEVLRLWKASATTAVLTTAPSGQADRVGARRPHPLRSGGRTSTAGHWPLHRRGDSLIAFDAREPILEANTVRLFSRLLAFRGDPILHRRSKATLGIWHRHLAI